MSGTKQPGGRRYTPIQNESARLQDKRSPAFQSQVLAQRASGMTETPKMTTPFVPVANPITKGDKSAGRGRYEKGRKDKSRS